MLKVEVTQLNGQVVKFEIADDTDWNRSVQDMHNRDFDFVQFIGVSAKYVFPKRDIVMAVLIKEDGVNA